MIKSQSEKRLSGFYKVISNSISLDNKWLTRSLFAVLFIYLLLRALLVTPLLDELGTLFWFIQTGDIINDKAVIDANNHLLNSFVGHFAYKLVGDHLLAYRILAVASFPIYYFSVKKLVRENISKFQFIVFLALISIHWLFDYFSLSRGYAPSLAFFMLSLSFVPAWNQSFKSKHLIYILLGFVFCLLANLSMIISVLLLFGYLMLTFLIHWKTQTTKHKLYIFGITMVFLFVVYKIYEYIEKLKDAGALWWGSKKGIWEVTGKSVSENIFFTDSEFVKYGLLLSFLVILAVFIQQWIKKGFHVFSRSIQFWSTGLFFLCLISIELMVKLMNVNYPQDRVAMYLVILFILSVGSLFSEIKVLKWSLLLLLWFPISFLFTLNLKTTIFSPQDRIESSFFQEIQKIIGPEDLLTADYVGHACYAYQTRNTTISKMAVLNQSDTLIGEDYRLESYYGIIKDWSNYTCVMSDSVTRMKLYKRNEKLHQIALKDTSIQLIESKEMYIPLIDFKMGDLQSTADLKITMNGSLFVEKGNLHLDIIQDLSDSNNLSIDYNSTLFDWYFGHKENFSFNYSRKIVLKKSSNQKLTVYLYNPDLVNLKLSDFKLTIYSLEKSKGQASIKEQQSVY